MTLFSAGFLHRVRHTSAVKLRIFVNGLLWLQICLWSTG